MGKRLYTWLLLSLGVVTGALAQSVNISGGNEGGVVICAQGYLYAWGTNKGNRLGLEPAEFVKALENENYLGLHILAEGKAIVQYIRQQGARAAQAYGFDVMIDGKVKALCLLTGDFGSIPLELTAKERGAEVIINCNRVDIGVYRVSVFAVDGDAPIDLGAYMKAFYTGGGHHNAASGMLTQENFLHLVNNQVL